MLTLLWWNTVMGNIAYFDGTTMIQIPNNLFSKGRTNKLSFALKFPDGNVRDGIVLFISGVGDDNFYIVYVQDGKLILNTKNNKLQSIVVDTNLETIQNWRYFEFRIDDEFKDVPIYFGGAPTEHLPVNVLVFNEADQTNAIPFPTNGLMASINNCYLNDVNISTMFRKVARTYC
jgi:hypothetical protein